MAPICITTASENNIKLLEAIDKISPDIVSIGGRYDYGKE